MDDKDRKVKQTPDAPTESPLNPESSDSDVRDVKTSRPTVEDIDAFKAPVERSDASRGKKKQLLLGGIVAAALVIFGGGGVLAYNLWYQNPDKVIVDSVMKAMSADSVKGVGHFSLTNKDTEVMVMVNNTSSATKGIADVAVTAKLNKDLTVELKGEGIYAESGDLYVRVNDLQQSYDKVIGLYVDSVAAQYGESLTTAQKDELKGSLDVQFQPLVEKLDEQWIKVSADDIADLNKEAGDTQKCLTNVIEKIKNDKQMSDEVGQVYRENKFLIIKDKLGSKDGSLGYHIDIDTEITKRFGEALANTTFGKELKKCDTSNELGASSTTDDVEDLFKDSRAEVWIDRWSHELTAFNLKGSLQDAPESKFDMTYETEFNVPVSATAPADAMTIQQLQQEFEELSSAR